MALDGSIVLYPERLFNPRGPVHIWAQKVTTTFEYWAQREAPKRSGELAASVWGEVNRVGPEALDMLVGASAAHTMYVVGGTANGYVGPRRLYNPAGMTKQGSGRSSPVSQSGRSLVPSYMFRTGGPDKVAFIRGQDSQNFFARAFHRTKGRFPSIGSYQDYLD